MDRRVDLGIGLFVLAFGLFVLVTASTIRPTGPVVDAIGPRGVPYVLGVFFLIGGGSIVLSRLRAWRSGASDVVKSDGEPDEPGVPASALQAFMVMAAAFGYALLLNRLGYVIATPAFVIVTLKTMRLRSWVVVLATAVAYTLVTYVLFALYMRVDLPVGPLTDLFRSLGLAR